MIDSPSYEVRSWTVIGICILCYFLGVAIRKITMPGRKSPPWLHQILLGIPVCLAVLGSMLPLVSRTWSDFSVFLVFALIIQQGMILNEFILVQMLRLGK